MAKDAIVLLKEDHKAMRKLFRQFEKAGADAKATKDRVARQIIEELTVHTYLENECMYPEVRRLLPEVEDDVLESYEEHHVADVLVMELAGMTPDDDFFHIAPGGERRIRLRRARPPTAQPVHGNLHAVNAVRPVTIQLPT